MNCRGTTKGGNSCSARPRPGTDRCPWHSDDLAEQRQAWSRKGGTNSSSKARARRQIPDGAMSAAEICGLLGVVLKAVIAGRIQPNIANAAANLGRTIIAAQEAAEFDARLAALEAGDVAAEPPA